MMYETVETERRLGQDEYPLNTFNPVRGGLLCVQSLSEAQATLEPI